LNRPGGPVEPASDQPVRAGLSPAIFFQSRSTFLTGRSLCWARHFSLSVCVSVAPSFPLCGHFFPGAQTIFCFFLLSLSAPFFFSVAFCRALQSPVTSPARSVFFFFLIICCRSADRQVIHSARALLFPCAVTFPWRAQCFVFLLLPLCRLQRLPCPVTSRAQKNFFWAVHAEAFYFFLSGPSREWRIVFWVCMQSQVISCLRAQFFCVLPGQQQGCACRFLLFFCPVTSSSCAQI
jgi:hypothetical protein